jgi:hypothetical protein
VDPFEFSGNVLSSSVAEEEQPLAFRFDDGGD